MPRSQIKAISTWEKSERRHLRRMIAYVLSGVAIVSLGGLLIVADGNFRLALQILGSASLAVFAAQTAISLIVGIGSSMAYAKLENTRYRSALDLIRNAGPPDLVDDTIDLLYDAEGCFMYDYEVEHTLARRSSGMFILTVRYKYKKLFKNRNLAFEIMRLKTSQQIAQFNENQGRIDATYRKNELFYYTTEDNLIAQFGEIEVDSAFNFHHLSISGASGILISDPVAQNRWLSSIPHGIDLSAPIELEYEFIMGIEESDVRFIEINFPTKGTEISFILDSSIRSSTKAEAFEFLTGSETNAYVAFDEASGRHRIQHAGWLLPKCGAGFYWYPARTPAP